MSDIGIDFPVWAAPLLIGLLYWPFLLVAAAILAGVAMLVHGWPRAGLFALATIAVLPCLMVLVMDAVSEVHSIASRQAYARTHQTLSAPLSIQGLNLPAGTAVEWADERHQAVASVELPGPTALLGTTLTGKLEDVSSRWWSGTLAADARLEGWPCRAGDVWLSHEGRPMRCTLAGDSEQQGLEIPAGSEVALAATGQLQDLRLPPDRTMGLPSIGATLPGGGSLFLRPDGAIERAYVPEPGVLQLGDAALRFEVRWVYPETSHPSASVPAQATAVRGDLAEDAAINGIPVRAGSLVTVELASHAVRVTPSR